MRIWKHWITKLLLLVAIIIAVAIFLQAVSNLGSGKSLEDKKQLENALQKAVVACYSIEGAYPPDVDYLLEHYAIVYDSQRFIIKYEYYGSNIMPDITVLER